MPAVAMTDSGNLFGALEFSLTAGRAGISRSSAASSAATERMRGPEATARRRGRPDQIVLLVQDETGYRT